MGYEFYRIMFVWGLIPIVLIVYLTRKVRGVGKRLHNKFISPIESTVNTRLAEEQRIYDNLPELGKKRVDKRRARVGKGVVAIAGLSWIGVMCSIFPPIWVPAFVVGLRWIHRNWTEYDDETKPTDKILAA